MTLKTKKRNIAKTILIVILVILLLAGTGVASFFITKAISDARENQGTSQTDSSSTDSSKQDSSTSGGSTSDESKSEDTEDATTDQTPAQYDGDNPNKAESLSGLITYAGVSEGSFLVNVSIDQYVSGNCDIILENAAGQTNTYSTVITAGPTSGFCSYEGPIPAAGAWKITVKINGNGKTGTVTGEVNI